MNCIAIVLALAFALAQQPGSYKREVPNRLRSRARVSEDSSRVIALARVPGAQVQALELENENGHLIWSWELKLPGHSGIEEVNVNALDGSIVGVEHEEPRPLRRDSTVRRARPR